MYPTDEESLRRDCEVEFVRASGPGGQHRNRRETGVRLVHGPSGVVIMATERRSQAMNLAAAFARMAERLEERNRPEVPRVPTKVPRVEKVRRVVSKRRMGDKKALRRPPASEPE